MKNGFENSINLRITLGAEEFRFAPATKRSVSKSLTDYLRAKNGKAKNSLVLQSNDVSNRMVRTSNRPLRRRSPRRRFRSASRSRSPVHACSGLSLSMCLCVICKNFLQKFVINFCSQYKLSNGGEVIRTDIQVGDNTRPFFSVSLWQKQMASMAVAGDIILLHSELHFHLF